MHDGGQVSWQLHLVEQPQNSLVATTETTKERELSMTRYVAIKVFQCSDLRR